MQIYVSIPKHNLSFKCSFYVLYSLLEVLFKFNRFCVCDVIPQKQFSMYECCLKLNIPLENAWWMGLWYILGWAGKLKKSVIHYNNTTGLNHLI